MSALSSNYFNTPQVVALLSQGNLNVVWNLKNVLTFAKVYVTFTLPKLFSETTNSVSLKV